MSTSGNKTLPGIMGLFAKTKTPAQALVEVGALATKLKRKPPVLLLEDDKTKTKKQSPRLLKFSASASRLSRASRFPSGHAPRRPKQEGGTQCHVTFEREWPTCQKSLVSLKPILASTECGGELKIVLKEFTQLLVCDDEFSRDMEREINEQRKSAHKSILVCHFTLVTQAS